ncbi:hypothetical protein [Candidatus Cyanaurora vandensis]|uniref:hypothetical protein n=1 Tax=Candidatus Cyanaurora vandensis TaxID=2714958 RepID=UPI00257BDB8B|nr:hypothetical protein [Candidatus Cyanaurora vandensis]
MQPIFLLDTSILVHYIRRSLTYQRVEQKYNLLSSAQPSYISRVTVGEIISFAMNNSWGDKKIDHLYNLLGFLIEVPLALSKKP